MKRREVLEAVAAGMAAGGPAAGSHGTRDGPRRAGRRSRGASSRSQSSRDPESLRDVAAFMDPEKPAQRLFGNGPPFHDGRPRHWNVSDLSFSFATVDVDDPGLPGGLNDPPDPPKTRVVSGPVDLAEIEEKVTYDGVRYLDAPKGSAPSGTTRLSGGESHSSQDVYEYNLFFADQNAYDLGMVNRTRDNDSLAAGYTDKGIVESHRWISPADGFRTRRQAQQGEDGFRSPGPPTPEWRSLRNVVDRHRNGVRHTVAWQNVKLPLAVPGEWGPTERGVRRSRARAWGEHFGHAGFDVVGMCELYSDKLLKRVEKEYDGWYPATDWEYGKKSLRDLGVLVGKRADGDDRVRRRIVHTESKVFDETGPLAAGVNKEGWQRVVVEVPPLPGNPRFEVFVSHLQPVIGIGEGNTKQYEDRKQQTKIAQMRELRDEIAERNDERPEQPKLLLGDFNIHAAGRGGLLDDDSGVEKGEYFSNFMHQMHSVGMQEAWLTRGGPGPDGNDCRIEGDEGVCNSFEPPRGESRASYYRGDRLDYVFVEKPRPDHDLRLDLSRLKMFSFDDHRWGKLSDHPGIRFELLTSPAT